MILQGNGFDWMTLLSMVGGALLGGGGGWVFFSSKMKEARAQANKAETEALDARHDYLQERITTMEQLYSEQSQQLDAVRKEMLLLKEMIFKKDNRIAELEAENKKLTKRVTTLEKELENYKKKIK